MIEGTSGVRATMASGAMAADAMRQAAHARPLPGAPRAASKKSAQDVFDGMPNDFLADKAKGVKLTVLFKLSGSGGGEWYVDVKDGKISVSKGSGPKPDVTMMTTAENYVKLANGDMNGMMAFMRGKIRLDGPMALMRKFEALFKPVG